MKKYLERYIDSKKNEKECYVHFGHYNEDLLLPLVQLGWHQTKGGYGYGPMIRDHWLLHFVRKGKGIVRVEDMEYEVNESQIFAIRPHQITYYESSLESPWEYYYIGFRGNWAVQIMKDIGFIDEESIVVRIHNPDVIFSLLKKMKKYTERYLQNGDGALGIYGCIYEIFQLFSEESEKACIVSEGVRKENFFQNEYTKTIISIIETSFSEQISIQELANRLHLNRSYMSELFAKDTGMSIKSYLTDRRMQWAMIRLQDPKCSVKSVASACGYSDSLYFSKVFHQTFGISPTKYREKIEKSKKSTK